MSDIGKRIERDGLEAAAYLQVMREAADAAPGGLDDLETEHLEYTRLNLHRTERIGRHWRSSPELEAQLERIDAPQTWLVLTEPWCGDSAQCLPCIVRMVETRPNLTLRMMLRDSHLDVMDRFLTGGKRAIPRLIAFDETGTELFRWGPRPAAAQAVFDAADGEGLDKPAKLERLHLFYGRDRGRALDAEFVSLLDGFRTGRS